ncbi:MAG: Npt1/Npt2 family nucleotide transporter [Candidatus Poribacteria bacterium]|nr:Npt1/Npt2 family nucleotide transporter [Candidatus Poribacteria bacterium]
MLPRRILYAAFAISAAASFLLCGYEFIRAVSTSLFIDAYGSENLPRVWMVVSPSIILILYIYGLLLSWLGATRTLVVTSVLSALFILICYYALLVGIPWTAAIVYVFREAYIVIIIEQFWSFVNSTLTSKQAKAINGPFCAIASLGSYAGGKLVSRWAEPLGTETLLLFTAGSLIPAAIFCSLAYYFAGEPKPSVDEEGGKRGHLGLKTFLSSKYLILLGVLILSTQVISTVLDLRFNNLVEAEITVTDTRTAYYGNFYGNLGLVAAILQLAAVPIALRFISIRFVHICIPIVHFINGFVLTLIPTLRSGAWSFLTFKALDYSFFRAAKELFYMPLTYDERYRAKQIIDSFGYRFGKGGSGGVLELVRLFVKTIPGAALSITAMIVSCIWSGVVQNLATNYQKIVNTEKKVDNNNSIR